MHRLVLLLALILGLGACGLGRPHRVVPVGPNYRRSTSFKPATNVTGSRLATDRVLKIDSRNEGAVDAVAGVKLGVLEVVVEPGLAGIRCLNEDAVWPGASVDAAALGATHAKTISLEAPSCHYEPKTPVIPKVVARYELIYVAPDRWSELPEGLRPQHIPPSAIRDVQPGNWVRPPTVVDMKTSP